MFERRAQTHEMQSHGLPVSTVGVRRMLRGVGIDEPLGHLGLPPGVVRMLLLECRAVQRPTPRSREHVRVHGAMRRGDEGTATKAPDLRHRHTAHASRW